MLEVLPSGSYLQRRYKIKDVISKKINSVVYLAEDEMSYRQKVALKQFNCSAVNTQEFSSSLKDFIAEVNIWASIDHPLLTKIKDLFLEEDSPFLVMEYLEGETFEKILLQSKELLTEEKVLEWADQLLELLIYLHSFEPPLILYDLKPAHIMLTVKKNIKVFDYGLARFFVPKGFFKKMRRIGTIGYIPVEQYGKGIIDHRSNIYTLGVTLYRLLSGYDPVQNPGNFPPLGTMNPNISSRTEQIIMKSINKDIEVRFQTAFEMRQALLEGIGSIPCKYCGFLNLCYKELCVNCGSVLPQQITAKETQLEKVRKITEDDWPMFRKNPQHIGATGDIPSPPLRLIWKSKLGQKLGSSPAFYMNNVYIGSSDKNVYCIEGSTGKEIWRYTTKDVLTSSPAVAGGVVYIGGWDCNFYALSAYDGTLIWKYYARNVIETSPAIGEGMVFWGAYDRTLYALDLNNGEKMWSYQTGNWLHGSPAVARGMVFIGSCDGHLYALEAATGNLVWKFRTKNWVETTPCIWEDMVFIGSWDANIYALDISTGEVIWKRDLRCWIKSSPAVDAGRLFVGAWDGNVYCFKAYTGEIYWRIPTKTWILSSPVIGKQYLYIGSGDGNLYCMDIRSGRIWWEYQTGGPLSSSPAVGMGKLFIGSYDGYLYAFG